MANHEVSILEKVMSKLVHKALLRQTIEVDHHVPAKNDVETVTEGECLGHEVEPRERDDPA